jgi:TRAP-type C4-dicarboxylate transport system substrate-binding protein
MLKRALTLLVMIAVVVGVRTAHADDSTVLKVGTLAPAESPWGQVFKIWGKAVTERTNGTVSLQFFWNGQQGDEGAMVGKMRTGQLDGSAITGTGLSMIYKQVLVLQLPGLLPTWDKLDAVRNAMRPSFDTEFEKQGFKVLGWGDVGLSHVMSKGFEVRSPADLKHKNAYYLAGDPIEPMFYSVVGDVTPKQVSVPEILTGLSNGTVNVVNAPALAAEQLQWASRLDHINTVVSGIEIGAIVFSSAKLKSLPADAATAVIETGKVAGDALTGRIRREDSAAFARLKARMVTTEPTADEISRWEKLFADSRARLRGTVFDPVVFDTAVQSAR